MAGLRQTTILVFTLVPLLMTGCAGTGSRFANWRRSSAESQDETWAKAQRLEQEGRLAEARQLYAQLYQTDSTSARYAHRMGVVSTLLGDHEKGSAAYRRALELEPNNAEVLADAGYSACLQKEYARAEQLLKASLTHASDNPRAKSNLALAVGLQGRDEECEALFREVHGQDEVEVVCNLAYVKSQRGDVKEAIDLYQQAVAIDPTARKAAVALAQLKADARAGTIAQKPYRKYMHENRPQLAAAKTESQVEVAQSAAKAKLGTAAEGDAALAVRTHTDAAVTPAGAHENLADWSEDDEALESSSSNIARNFPVEADVQTVTTDDSPFTVVEAPAGEETAATGFADPWAAGPESGPARYSPAAQADRLAQITARSGQSGFMGFCPVALRDETRLIDTQPQFTAEYQSQNYEFGSEAAQKKFEANPERYLAAAGGLDVVAVSQGTAVAQGSLEHALWFRHKLYLFLNAENRELFRQQARQFAVQQ